MICFGLPYRYILQLYLNINVIHFRYCKRFSYVMNNKNFKLLYIYNKNYYLRIEFDIHVFILQNIRDLKHVDLSVTGCKSIFLFRREKNVCEVTMGKPIYIIIKRRLVETPYRSISDRIFRRQPIVRKNNLLCWRNKIQLAILNVCFHSSRNLNSYRLQNKEHAYYLSIISSEKPCLSEMNFHDEGINLDDASL